MPSFPTRETGHAEHVMPDWRPGKRTKKVVPVWVFYQGMRASLCARKLPGVSMQGKRTSWRNGHTDFRNLRFSNYVQFMLRHALRVCSPKAWIVV